MAWRTGKGERERKKGREFSEEHARLKNRRRDATRERINTDIAAHGRRISLKFEEKTRKERSLSARGERDIQFAQVSLGWRDSKAGWIGRQGSGVALRRVG